MCCSYRNSQDVIGFIPCGIRARLPQLAKSMSELCLVYEADSNWGWWELCLIYEADSNRGWWEAVGA
jgi:hypothetical protein